jgi:DNA transformation protein and related proteins
MAAISSLRNLGPATEAAFHRIGIRTAEELLAIGADAAYARLLEAGTRPHFIGYYVLHMAVQGRSWTDCKGDEKAALRIRFEALKARDHDAGRAALERALDALGVIDPAKAKPG